MAAEPTFEEWIDSLVGRHGTVRRVAEQIGMTESGFFRGVKRGTLSVENLLLLAQFADEQPSRVLRMGGKANVAQLIEELYGAPSRDALTSSQRELLTTWDEIPERMQAPFEVLLRYARELAAGTGAQTPAAAPAPRRRRRAATRRTPRAARSE